MHPAAADHLVDPLGAATIEAVARRVAQLLRAAEVQRDALLTAAQVAARLGVDRSWVYAHANELGAVRLGNGPRARLRFDPAVVEQVVVRRRGPRATVARRVAARPTTRLLPIKSPTRAPGARTLG
jgi:predicted DNA-binding transcriptional regulator AlpA